jgi:hypothetical protein
MKKEKKVKSNKHALFEDDSSSSDEEEDSHESDELIPAMPAKDPAELVFEKGVQDMNDFLHKVKEFEKITNSHFEDKWKIKDLAFQPLKV